MSVIGAVVGSALAVLEQPRWLLLALAGFLVRGGLLILFIPLIQVPTTAALANLLGPTLVGFVFGGVSAGFLVLVGTVVGALLAWLILGGLAGAAMDLGLVRGAAAAEDLEGPARPSRGSPARAAVVRWLAHLPTLAVILFGASPLVDAVYQELIHPGDPSLPIVARIVLRVPAVVGGLAAAWVLGEIVGGLAVRHLAWGSSVADSLVRAVASLLRPSGVLVAVLTDLAFLGAIAAGWIALGLGFDEIRTLVRDGAEPWAVALGFLLLSIAWLGSLWLLAIATAWRSAAWTFEVARRLGPRTIGEART
jgi:hypothetical protein